MHGSFRRSRRPASALALAVLSLVLLVIPVGSAQTSPAAFTLGGWELAEFIQGQPACTGAGYDKRLFSRPDCGFGRVTLSPAAAKTVVVEFVDGDGTIVDSQSVATLADGIAEFAVTPTGEWDPGTITVRASVAPPDTGSAELQFVLNPLEATVSATQGTFAPGEPVTVTGLVNELDSVTCCVDNRTPVPANVTATLHTPDGTQLGAAETATADGEGRYTLAFPGTATAGLEATAETDFELALGVRATVTYHDPTPFVGFGIPPTAQTSGRWLGTGAGAAVVKTPPETLLVRNRFVSSLGWVKPGQTYPFRVLVENHTPQTETGARVTIPAPPGVTFAGARALDGGALPTVSADSITWHVGTVPAATDDGPTVRTLVVEARAKSLGEDPELAWKDLSSTASLTYDGHATPLTSKSHGPKAIPPAGGFETARYGDKPFPIVPVDFRDRAHEERHSGDALSRKVNARDVPGSTFNLYQEMSFGQLFPFGDVPSTGIATAGFDYEPGFDFSTTQFVRPDGTPSDCRGTTFGGDETRGTWGTVLYPERIRDGWYQLPGDTEYYGGDYPAFTATSAPPVQLDSACGPIGKGVYDAAVIADPEIDYNDFDSDKDGVVDFFMLVFVGLGGNGDSQINGVPPYDNIWPHSSSLEYYFTDETTGLPGYTSDDQLTDLEGVPQCWKDTTYSASDDCAAAGGTGRNDLPVHVRVGPYNVNPESAIDQASVIAHEYGHHLGLPDFYSTSYSAYNDWNLMASDHSQHMTVFGKQELGWVVPRYLQPGESVQANDWEEIKNDTGTIEWQTPTGQPYTLSAANGDQGIHNGQAYGLKLPGRIILPADQVPSGRYVWWSERGNDFGCTPEGGHNLDIALPELASLPAGTPVKVSFRSRWDIEWDFDYGFTLVTTDGSSYASLPSAKGYTTTKAQNPNQSGCLNRHDNGLTGTSGSYAAGTQAVDRVTNTYAASSPFVDDEYDLTAYAGQSGVVLRFSYYSDPGLDRPGWMIDDLKVTAGSDVVYSTDFEAEDEVRIFPGGCGEGGVRSANRCTSGWTRLQGGAEAAQDHGYYLELRDRSGFDFQGRGEADRGAIGWSPGVLVEYTDQVRGYGNNGGGMPPRQHYLDSQPQPGYDCGNNIYETDPDPDVLTPSRCQDAAFTAAAGDSAFSDVGWIDNFTDDSAADKRWHFDYGCLTLNVLRMSGEGASEALPSDLSADAVITAGEGCTAYDYGGGDAVNGAPTAVADAKPTNVEAGETVTLDGGGSYDDLQPAGELDYAWDVDGDGDTDETGQVVTHVYEAAGTYDATLRVTDSEGLSDTDSVTITVTEAPVTETCVEDDDPLIAYTSGWHSVADTDASGDRFALHTGRDAGHSARFTFTVASGKTGAVAYQYAKSSKGGSADVFVDGVLRETVSFVGSAKSARDPDFGFSSRFEGLPAGQHTIELRNMRDAVYLDALCLEQAGAAGSPSPTGPGATTSETSTLGIGQQLGRTLTVPTGAQAISVAAESSLGLPIRLLLISPSGSVLAASEASTGLATIDQPVTEAGAYIVKVVNLSLGPLQVWSVATPWGTR